LLKYIGSRVVPKITLIQERKNKHSEVLKLKVIVNEILKVIEDEINSNISGSENIGSEYWYGRLFSSVDLEDKIIEILKRGGYKNGKINNIYNED
jgi:hypothetical protein